MPKKKSPQTNDEKLPYVFNILIAIDQLGNALANGNPDNTVSARVGYFASEDFESKLKPYWKTLEWVIDFTFRPLQGPRHCFLAWQAEQDEKDSQSTYFFRVILGLIVILGCIVISAFLWPAVLIVPRWRYKPGDPRYDKWREARQRSAKLGSQRRPKKTPV